MDNTNNKKPINTLIIIIGILFIFSIISIVLILIHLKSKEKDAIDYGDIEIQSEEYVYSVEELDGGEDEYLAMLEESNTFITFDKDSWDYLYANEILDEFGMFSINDYLQEYISRYGYNDGTLYTASIIKEDEVFKGYSYTMFYLTLSNIPGCEIKCMYFPNGIMEFHSDIIERGKNTDVDIKELN